MASQRFHIYHEKKYDENRMVLSCYAVIQLTPEEYARLQELDDHDYPEKQYLSAYCKLTNRITLHIWAENKFCGSPNLEKDDVLFQCLIDESRYEVLDFPTPKITQKFEDATNRIPQKLSIPNTKALAMTRQMYAVDNSRGRRNARYYDIPAVLFVYNNDKCVCALIPFELKYTTTVFDSLLQYIIGDANGIRSLVPYELKEERYFKSEPRSNFDDIPW